MNTINCIEGNAVAADIRIGIVASRFNEFIVSKLLGGAVDGLDEPERTLFFRYYYEGERLKTIAGELGLNLSTVKTKLARGRKRLREQLRETGGEEHA